MQPFHPPEAESKSGPARFQSLTGRVALVCWVLKSRVQSLGFSPVVNSHVPCHILCLMAHCIFCKAPTYLHVNGQPVCLRCDQALEAKATLHAAQKSEKESPQESGKTFAAGR